MSAEILPEEIVLLWNLRPVCDAGECEVDLNVIELHLDDGDVGLADGAKFAHLVLITQQVEQGVEKFKPGRKKRGECSTIIIWHSIILQKKE